jgi:hypothetical protein
MSLLEISVAALAYLFVVAAILRLLRRGRWETLPRRIRGRSEPVTPLDWRKGRGMAARHRVRPPRAFPGVEW